MLVNNQVVIHLIPLPHDSVPPVILILLFSHPRSYHHSENLLLRLFFPIISLSPNTYALWPHRPPHFLPVPVFFSIQPGLRGQSSEAILSPTTLLMTSYPKSNLDQCSNSGSMTKLFRKTTQLNKLLPLKIHHLQLGLASTMPPHHSLWGTSGCMAAHMPTTSFWAIPYVKAAGLVTCNSSSLGG